MRRDLKANPGLRASRVLTGLLVILGKKASLEIRVLWVRLVHRVRLATPAPEE